MQQQNETLQKILEYRPELQADTIIYWTNGISGCTLQAPHQTLSDLLYRARHNQPMPWET